MKLASDSHSWRYVGLALVFALASAAIWAVAALVLDWFIDLSLGETVGSLLWTVFVLLPIIATAATSLLLPRFGSGLIRGIETAKVAMYCAGGTLLAGFGIVAYYLLRHLSLVTASGLMMTYLIAATLLSGATAYLLLKRNANQSDAGLQRPRRAAGV